MSVRHLRACYCKTIVYVDWRSLRRVSSVLSIILTCGKWAWCQTLNSDSSMLLPSRFCTPLNEQGRPGKDEAVNEVGGTSWRWMSRQGRVNSHLHWPNSSSNTLHRIWHNSTIAVGGCAFWYYARRTIWPKTIVGCNHQGTGDRARSSKASSAPFVNSFNIRFGPSKKMMPLTSSWDTRFPLAQKYNWLGLWENGILLISVFSPQPTLCKGTTLRSLR